MRLGSAVGSNSISIPIAEADLRHAESATTWICATHPDVVITLLGQAVELSGPLSDTRLSAIWVAALLNERLVSAAEQQRTALLDSLLQ